MYAPSPADSRPVLRVEIELGAGIGDVEVAHGQLADAVRRRERASSTFSMLSRSGW